MSAWSHWNWPAPVGHAGPGRRRPEIRRRRNAGRVVVDHRQRPAVGGRAGVDDVDTQKQTPSAVQETERGLLADAEIDLLLFRRRALAIATAECRSGSRRRPCRWPSSRRPRSCRSPCSRIPRSCGCTLASQPAPGAKPSLSSTNSPGLSVVAGWVQLIGLAMGTQTQGAFGPETTAALPGSRHLVEHDRAVVGRVADIGDPDGEVAAAFGRAACHVGALLDLDVGLLVFRRTVEVLRNDDVDGLRAAEARRPLPVRHRFRCR